MDLKGRNFLTLKDFTPEEITYMLDLAADLKDKKKKGIPVDKYRGMNVALIFEKTSTRTRCAFEVAAHDMGMGTTYLDPTGSQIGKKESIEDTARVLGRMFDGIEYRGFGQEIVEELAKYIEEIASGAPELPFYYYHIPAFNGAFLPMVKLLETLDGRVPNFAGIKYTFESLYEYNQCRLYGGGKFDMLHGQDETILPCLAMGGARGGIGGTTNYNGRELTAIIDAWNRGDIEAAREHQNFSQEVINVICHYRGNIVGGKRIMKLIGLDLGPNRVPFQNMTDEEEAAMKAELEAIDFFNRCNKF